MPDLGYLAMLGFRAYPRWYRDSFDWEAGATVPMGSTHSYQPFNIANFS